MEASLQAKTGRIHDRTRTLRRKVRFSLAPRAPSIHDPSATLAVQRSTRETMPGLLDHFVGAHEKRFRDRESERLRGGEVDDQIELGWLLNRDVGRLGAA